MSQQPWGPGTLAREHERAKDPLPTPLPRPHPQGAALDSAYFEAAFPLIQAVAQYETAAVHRAQFAALAEADKLTDLDADSLAHAEELMDGARATLANAGRLDLIEATA